jgi:MFS family permease
MTFLPIIDRELRVAARKRSTFWLRVASALVGIAIGGAIMMLSRIGAFSASVMGDSLFTILTWLALLVALSAGLFLTSDCLSEEKREGTLGFLFLTDLRGYDVAGGKLLAASLRVTYALMSVIPILAVTFLMGAVSGPQYWKTALALLNALFFSLSAGLMVSALSRDMQKALGATVLVLLLLALGGGAIDAIYCESHRRMFRPLLSLASPAYAFSLAGAWGRSLYWPALGISHALGWGMLALACLTVPRSWQEKKGRNPRASRRSYWWRYGGARRRQALRRKLLDRNPILWLSCRERWQSTGMWAVSLIMAGMLAAFLVWKEHDNVWSAWSQLLWLFVALMYLWMASQASRFYVEARRSGLLELLLVAPLSVKQVVQGHWRALVRMFGAPVTLLLLVQFAVGCLAFPTTWGAGVPPQSGHAAALIMPAASTLSTLASLAALAWFGMWMGMTSRNASLATLKTVLFVKVIPFLVIYFVTAYAMFLLVIMPQALRTNKASGAAVTTTITNASGATTTVTSSVPLSAMTPLYMALVMTCLPAALNVALDLGFIALARRKLHSTFRQKAARTLVPASPPASAPPVIQKPPP